MQDEGRTRGVISRTAVGVPDLLMRVKIFYGYFRMSHSSGPAPDGSRVMVDVRRHGALLLETAFYIGRPKRAADIQIM